MTYGKFKTFCRWTVFCTRDNGRQISTIAQVINFKRSISSRITLKDSSSRCIMRPLPTDRSGVYHAQLIASISTVQLTRVHKLPTILCRKKPFTQSGSRATDSFLKILQAHILTMPCGRTISHAAPKRIHYVHLRLAERTKRKSCS